QQVQLIGLWNGRLDKDRADLWVNTDREIIQYRFSDISGNLSNIFWLGLGGQRVQIGDDEERFVLMLQTHTIRKRANIVTEMQPSCWAITSEEAGFVYHRLFPFLI